MQFLLINKMLGEFSRREDGIRTRESEAATEFSPVRYDIERMNKALEGPEVLLPAGLSEEEILAFLDKVASEIQ